MFLSYAEVLTLAALLLGLISAPLDGLSQVFELVW